MAKRPMREVRSRCFTKGTAECAALCAGVGAGVALSLITLGIWKTLLIALCVSMGAFIGGVKDKKRIHTKSRGTVWDRPVKAAARKKRSVVAYGAVAGA